MEEIVAFLDQLMRNNNREWFNAHKSEYLAVQHKFNLFAERLMEEVAAFDEDMYGLTLKDCTYRIYRDIRFSPDKRPYKNHMGCYICKGGKKSCNAGYYFHLEPDEAEYIGNNVLAAGIYNPTKEMVEHIRQEISSNGQEFDAALKQAKDFRFSESSYLKRVPNGFDKDSPYAEYLKLKDYSISLVTPKDILFGDQDKLLKYVIKQFKSAHNFNKLLNQLVVNSL